MFGCKFILLDTSSAFFFWFSRVAYYIRIKVFRVCGQSGVLKTQYSVIYDKNGQGPWGQIDEMKKNPQHIWSGVLVLYDIRPNKTTVIHHWTLIDKRREQKRFLGRRRNADEKNILNTHTQREILIILCF